MVLYLSYPAFKYGALIKEIKFSSYIRKFRVEPVAKSCIRKGFLMRKCANISPYMRRPLVISDFATAPF